MKRSRSIRLALMGTAALSLSACDDPDISAGAFESVGQCIADSRYDADSCDQARNLAQHRHLVEAPRYENKEDCEAKFGRNSCEVLPAHVAAKEDETANRPTSNMFIPYMTGFLIGKLASQQGAFSRPLYRIDPGAGAKIGGLYTGNGARIASGPGQVSVGAKLLTAKPQVTNAPASVVQRAGFGKTGSTSSVAS